MNSKILTISAPVLERQTSATVLAFYVGAWNSELHFCMFAWLVSYRQNPLPCLPGFSIYMWVCITGFSISIFPKDQCSKKAFRMISNKEFTKSSPSKYLWSVIIYIIQLHNVCIFNRMFFFLLCKVKIEHKCSCVKVSMVPNTIELTLFPKHAKTT